MIGKVMLGVYIVGLLALLCVFGTSCSNADAGLFEKAKPTPHDMDCQIVHSNWGLARCENKEAICYLYTRSVSCKWK